MNSKIKDYVQAVLKNVYADDATKNKIEKDLYLHINEASQAIELEEVLLQMGSPEEVASEFMEGIYGDNNELITQAVKESNFLRNYEYVSPITLFGLPLIHINTRRVSCKRPCIAKGIIALGDISIGFLSIGGIAIGIISLGALSAGIISLGALSLGILLALGGVSVGTLAVGGVAVGLGSIGGVAIGKIAVGGYARGNAAVGGQAIGKFVISGEAPNYSLNNVSREEVYQLIKLAYPNLSKWIVNIFTLPFR